MNDAQLKTVRPEGGSYCCGGGAPHRARICALPECDVEFRLDGYQRMQKYCCKAHQEIAGGRLRKVRESRKPRKRKA